MFYKVTDLKNSENLVLGEIQALSSIRLWPSVFVSWSTLNLVLCMFLGFFFGVVCLLACFSGLHPWHTQVPRLGVQSELRLQQRQIRALSATYTVAYGNAGSLTHWTGPGIEPTSSWILVEFVTDEPDGNSYVCFCWKTLKIHCWFINTEVVANSIANSFLNKANKHCLLFVRHTTAFLHLGTLQFHAWEPL